MQLDTRGDKFPVSQNVEFIVSEIPELQDDERSWLFKFTATIDGVKKNYQERFWPEGMKALALATGGKEGVPGVFDWEPTNCLGKSFIADIENQEQKSGKNKGKFFLRMVNIKDLPF